MPPAKSLDAKADAASVRERQIAAAAHARSKKNNGAAAQQNGSHLKELALVNTDSGQVVQPGQGTGVSRVLPSHGFEARLLMQLNTDGMEQSIE